MPGWYEDGEWIEDQSGFSDAQLAVECESLEPWRDEPSFIDRADMARKAEKEGGF
jgi:hypothetical protein